MNSDWKIVSTSHHTVMRNGNTIRKIPGNHRDAEQQLSGERRILEFLGYDVTTNAYGGFDMPYLGEPRQSWDTSLRQQVQQRLQRIESLGEPPSHVPNISSWSTVIARKIETRVDHIGYADELLNRLNVDVDLSGTSLVHTDPHLGNIVGIEAHLIDWETAFIGPARVTEVLLAYSEWLLDSDHPLPQDDFARDVIQLKSTSTSSWAYHDARSRGLSQDEAINIAWRYLV